MDLEASNSNNGETISNPDPQRFRGSIFNDMDSNCSTPYVSAPSSPGRGSTAGGYFYSAPASPMHFVLTSGTSKILSSKQSPSYLAHEGSFEFDFSARLDLGPSEPSMSSADELFLNGQIRPMKLRTHLERPQLLSPLPDLDADDGEMSEFESRGRDLRLRDKSLRRRTRSMSPMRDMPFEWNYDNDKDISVSKIESLSSEKNPDAGTGTPSVSASSSRSSSAGRSSKRWVFLTDFLRSKSEGSSHNKFWATISLKEKRPSSATGDSSAKTTPELEKGRKHFQRKAKPKNGSSSGGGKRRVPSRSAHELHYTTNRAQAEELRKKTFLPYRQGLFGCLGFSSKGYGAMNGFARALNTVSSR